MKTKLIIVLAILLFITTVSFAQVLVSTEIDKEEISLNEVARVTITLLNDSDKTITNYVIRTETSDNLVLLNNEQSIFAEVINELKPGILKEINYTFKSTNTNSDQGKIFVYYGEEGEFVTGTFINVKPSNVLFNTNAKKIVDDEGQKIIIDFEAQNYSSKMIYNVGAEVIAPDGFSTKTEPKFIPFLEDGNIYKTSFEILAPLGTVGEQKIIVAYGYFDENNPHYFEESHLVSFQDNNRFFLAGIGLIVLVIAALIYFNKTKTDQNIKGTKEKEDEK